MAAALAADAYHRAVADYSSAVGTVVGTSCAAAAPACAADAAAVVDAALAAPAYEGAVGASDDAFGYRRGEDCPGRRVRYPGDRPPQLGAYSSRKRSASRDDRLGSVCDPCGPSPCPVMSICIQPFRPCFRDPAVADSKLHF